jgi:hypothetical protein
LLVIVGEVALYQCVRNGGLNQLVRGDAVWLLLLPVLGLGILALALREALHLLLNELEVLWVLAARSLLLLLRGGDRLLLYLVVIFLLDHLLDVGGASSVGVSGKQRLHIQQVALGVAALGALGIYTDMIDSITLLLIQGLFYVYKGVCDLIGDHS